MRFADSKAFPHCSFGWDHLEQYIIEIHSKVRASERLSYDGLLMAEHVLHSDDFEPFVKSFINPDACECGELWESPCKCPERVLERFSEVFVEANGSQIFTLTDLQTWMRDEFGEINMKLIRAVLSINDVERVDGKIFTYKTPYEF